MTYMRAWMSLKFGQIRLLVPMATNRVILEKTVLPLFLPVFHPILFILTGNDDIHESSEVFEIRPDLTTDGGKKIFMDLSWENWCCHLFSAVLD